MIEGYRVQFFSEFTPKGKAFHHQVTETQNGDGILGFHPYFDIRHNQDGTVVSCTRRTHFTAWYSFLLQSGSQATECGQKGYATRKFSRIPQGIKPGSPVLRRSASNQLHHRFHTKRNVKKFTDCLLALFRFMTFLKCL